MSSAISLQTVAAKPLQTAGANLIVQRKCACGAGASSLTGECPECSKKKMGLQSQLRIGESGDVYEQEADRVAEQVLAAPTNPAVSSALPHIKRFTGQPSAPGTAAPASVDRVLASPGSPLGPALQQDMEERFGHDFSRVRVHSGGAAEQSAREVNAHAYTVGHNIVFGAGRFAPGTLEGRRLIAHELTHVVEQGRGGTAIQCAPVTGKSQGCNYEPGEKTKSRTTGFLELDVAFADYYFLNKPGAIIIADFGVDDGTLRPAAQIDLSQNWIGTFPKNATLEILGYTDCAGLELYNTPLREKRARAVANLFPPSGPTIKSATAAPMTDFVADNVSPYERALNRSAVIRYVLPPPPPNPIPESTPTPVVCTPPPAQSSPGKRCKFYVYDSTDETFADLWEVAAFGLAMFRPGAYVIPSGETVEEALKSIFDTYADKDCGCTEEVQFFSHGSTGNAMSISKTGNEITISDFNIPDLDKFGDGPTSMPGYREWSDKLTVKQRRMVLLRRIICDPDAEIYYRSCEAFQGKTGQEFAKASAEFWRSKVVGHTKVIGISQPGKKTLKPCQEPYWPEEEGAGALSGKKGKHKLRNIKPK